MEMLYAWRGAQNSSRKMHPGDSGAVMNGKICAYGHRETNDEKELHGVFCHYQLTFVCIHVRKEWGRLNERE